MKPTRWFRTQIRNSLLLITLLFSFLSAIAQPANDDCLNATVLTSGPACTSIAGTLRNAGGVATATPGINPFCGDATSSDVWYTFIAQTYFPTIRLSGMGSRMDDAPRLQLFNTTLCDATTLNANSNNCASGATATLNLVPATALVPGNTYLVRVYTNLPGITTGTVAQWGFNICVNDVPANDLCGAPTVLTSSTSCVYTTGNMFNAGLTATSITAPDCASGATYDVWYRFVAQTTNPTITLANIGADFTNPGIQLLQANCGAVSASYFCGTTSISASYLTPGTAYFIRVFSTSTTPPVSPVNAGFDICVVDPVITTPPANDECEGAPSLSVNRTCVNINSDMTAATPSATTLGGTCAGPDVYDIWFRFTAIGPNETVTLSTIGTNFLTPQIEILSGSCGSMSSVFCGASPLVATGLTPGTMYYVRVYSNTAPIPNGNARFNICVTTPDLPAVRFGNSYVNISKKNTGGVIEPGDTLEIRMTLQHSLASTTMSNLRFLDNLPTNTTMLTGMNDSIRIITNEGLTYKNYSPAPGDDAATFLASPPAGEFNIRMNLGFGTSIPSVPVNNTSSEVATATGTMMNTNFPKSSGLLFATAYRVVVTGAAGDTIKLNPAEFIYNHAGTDVTLTATPYKMLISNPLSLCTNSIGVNNAAEFGGTFGSGTTLNRPTDLLVPITGYSFMNNISPYNAMGDGRYAIVKNISPRNSTNRNANRVTLCGNLPYTDPFNCNNRTHNGHWYIDGDHTGTNDAIGNLPPDESTNSGYMLMVNADFVASEVYTQTINNLCPDTYYEFSAWVRNICPTCGVDSLGVQFSGTPISPANGYPGVYPNLSFSLNGLDYYSTGQLDTIGWLKKGFVFKTDSLQTSATFAIRNNSQGGGGNDWVMDDISVATCTPNLNLVPSGNSQVCYNTQVDIACDVISYFDNYVFYQWQISHDQGVTWKDTLAMGEGSPTLSGGNYIYTATFPSFIGDSAHHLEQYRIRVATSLANLYGSCSFANSVNIIVMMVDNCAYVLKTDLLSFNASLINKRAYLKWVSSNETAQTSFDVQKSLDGINFFKIGTVKGVNSKHSYAFTDPELLNGFAYYRIVVKEPAGQKISSTELLKTSDALPGFISVVNPFYDVLSFELYMSQNGVTTIVISDAHGKTLRSFKQSLVKGINEVTVSNLGSLADGTYILQVISNEGVKSKKVIKLRK